MGFQSQSLAQCTECGSPRIYEFTGTTALKNNPPNATLDDSYWTGSGNFASGHIAKFDRNLAFTWEASDFTLGGIILTNGADLTLDRPNEGDNPAFTIEGECITIGSGSILNLIYITALSNVTICIEEGGKLIMDSRSEDKNTFIFDEVVINLQGPDAELEFGNADIDILGENGLEINGWTGAEICENGNDPGSDGSGNITWTDDTVDICDLLNLRVLPVQWALFVANYDINTRSAQLSWSTLKEWENSHFEVERAQNGINSWEKIGEVAGVGYSDQPEEYTFTDIKIPLSGGSFYYRIRQVDLNGESNISKVVGLNAPAVSQTSGNWRVYPNPATSDRINIDILSPESYLGGEITFRLVGGMENTPYKTVGDIETFNSELRKTFSEMRKGILVLEVQWDNKLEMVKIIGE